MSAEFVLPPSFAVQRQRRSKAREDGVRYERKAQAYLYRMLGDRCLFGQWIKFTSASRPNEVHLCQPDTLVLNVRRGTINVIEIKLRHTSDAWWQINSLYMPLVKHIFGKDWDYIPVEIAKWFDAHTKFPERFKFVTDVIDLPSLSPDEFHVHLWDGKAHRK